MLSPTTRIAAIVAVLASALLVLSCSSPASDGHDNATNTDEPLLTGPPAGYNADDVAFTGNMIRHDQQGIDMSALVPDRSTDTNVIAFAAKSASALQSNMATLRVLLVQWNENPDAKTGNGGHGNTMKGMADPATVVKLASLHGSEFDTLWLQSMISRHEGAIEMANAEIANGKNVDAIGLAKQIVSVQGAEIGSMRQMLTG